MKDSDRARFLSFVQKSDSPGCWEWLGAKAKGYGQFGYSTLLTPDSRSPSKSVRAHRFSYQMHVGPIPVDMTVDHLCRNRGCVNPDHLEVVTRSVNSSRGNQRTMCARGLHELSGDNVIFRPRKPRERECRTCTNARRRQRTLERSAA